MRAWTRVGWGCSWIRVLRWWFRVRWCYGLAVAGTVLQFLGIIVNSGAVASLVDVMVCAAQSRGDSAAAVAELLLSALHASVDKGEHMGFRVFVMHSVVE